MKKLINSTIISIWWYLKSNFLSEDCMGA